MKVLVIAPHPDDEVLGVGGTMAKRVIDGHHVVVCVVTKGCEPLFDQHVIKQARLECQKAHLILGVKETIFLDFPAVMLDEGPRHRLNSQIFEIIQGFDPDEVYIPHRGDIHIDHKMISDASMVAMRPKYKANPRRIYAYETLSETGWDVPNAINAFIPTVYEDITSTVNKKIDAMKVYQSQLSGFPNARSIEAIEALAKYRGSTVNVEAAEAFMLIREIKK